MDALDKALAIDNRLGEAHWQRGVVLYKQGAYDDALAELRKAKELSPEKRAVDASLAELFEKRNDVTKAMASWQRAVGDEHAEPSWRASYAHLLLERGRGGEALNQMERAIKDAEKANEKGQWLMDTYFQVAQLQRKARRNDAARANYEKHLALAPPDWPDRRIAEAALEQLAAR
jgi:tetratricopeptide (TPR) repeat protein